MARSVRTTCRDFGGSAGVAQDAATSRANATPVDRIGSLPEWKAFTTKTQSHRIWRTRSVSDGVDITPSLTLRVRQDTAGSRPSLVEQERLAVDERPDEVLVGELLVLLVLGKVLFGEGQLLRG